MGEEQGGVRGWQRATQRDSGDGQWWSFRAGVAVSQVFITSFKIKREKDNDASAP